MDETAKDSTIAKDHSSIARSETLPAQLAARLKQPLPGAAAHRRYAPELSYGRQAGPPPARARRAAVLIALYRRSGEWRLPLTLRPAHMVAHAGQISLPGGMIERGESSSEAALRELREELGEHPPVELLGRLSDFYVFVSDFRVVPWVGVLHEPPDWRPNPNEVARVIELPLEHLLDPRSSSRLVVTVRGTKLRAPCFTFGPHPIWGATSMMLSELVEVVREVMNDD